VENKVSASARTSATVAWQGHEGQSTLYCGAGNGGEAKEFMMKDIFYLAVLAAIIGSKLAVLIWRKR